MFNRWTISKLALNILWMLNISA